MIVKNDARQWIAASFSISADICTALARNALSGHENQGNKAEGVR